jgi:hypothetical protein
MPPPRGEGMTGSPRCGPAPPRDEPWRPTSVRQPHHRTTRTPATRTFSSAAIACAERRRRRQGPPAADAVGPHRPILDPDAATGAAQKQRRTTEKRSATEVTPRLDAHSPFRDDNASPSASARAGVPPRRALDPLRPSTRAAIQSASRCSPRSKSPSINELVERHSLA